MGSSKKHKEKDRSRDKEHKHKRRHRSRSKDRDRKSRKDGRDDRHDKRRKYEQSDEHPPVSSSMKQELTNDSSASGGEKLSLSVEATNKIRAKLGLKPLDVGGSAADKTTDDSKPTKKEDVHVPAVNISTVKKTDDLRLKMAQLKEKRRINMLLGKVKTLGDSDSEDDALAWVKKSRKIQEEKQKAEKQAKMLEEMDAQFGIGDLVEEAFHTKKKYTSKDLTGLKVQHDQASFKEGKSVILTLADKGILDEELEDTLVNVNMIDNEKADQNIENKKKKPDYNPYADEFDDYGMLKKRDILEKYDEEIHGSKKDSFQLASGGKYSAEQERRLAEIKREIQSKGETLSLPAPMIASEYYTEAEAPSFNKVKKKTRKLRKKQKMVTAQDLLPLGDSTEGNMGSRNRKIKVEDGEILDTDVSRDVFDKVAPIPGLDLVEDMDLDKPDLLDESEILGPEMDLTGVPVEEDTAKLELETSLKKARRLKTTKGHRDSDKRLAEAIVKQEPTEMNSESQSSLKFHDGAIVLNATSEFCRSLGEIPTYGMAGNRPEDEDELMDFEQELLDRRKAQQEEEDEEAQPGWQSVQIDTRPVTIEEEEKAVLDEEPVVNEGLAAALLLADKKGYLDKLVKKSVSAPKHTDMEAKNYSIEDKRYDDLDEKYRKRDRYTSGIVMDFKDKSNYRPDVKLEYIDEAGRLMNPKEAFRYLSHRFHGKGSGKKKTEKRQKKMEEEQLMKSMSSTDTPLNTVALLMEKQKTEKSPFIVLSGSGKGTTSLSK